MRRRALSEAVLRIADSSSKFLHFCASHEAIAPARAVKTSCSFSTLARKRSVQKCSEQTAQHQETPSGAICSADPVNAGTELSCSDIESRNCEGLYQNHLQTRQRLRSMSFPNHAFQSAFPSATKFTGSAGSSG